MTTTVSDQLPPTESWAADADLLKPQEVARALRTTENGLRRWRAAGKGPRFLKLEGKAIRYRRVDVVEWLRLQASND